jgi:hypothetical protein
VTGRWPVTLEAGLAMRALACEVRKMRRYRAWWVLYDPVAYVWLCRAERRGALVPWSGSPP